MHNLYAIFVIFFDICKQFSKDLMDGKKEIFLILITKSSISDLEVIVFESDDRVIKHRNKNFFFAILQCHRKEITNLISGCQFNDRKKSVTIYMLPSVKGLSMKSVELRNISELIPCWL